MIRVGEYEIGYEKVVVYLDPKMDGGYFKFLPMPRVIIGGESGLWKNIAHILMHEAFEWACVRLHVRCEPSCSIGNDNGDYKFILSHGEMNEACALASELIVNCGWDLHKAWKKMKRKGKKK